jgi:hypothetical protein
MINFTPEDFSEEQKMMKQAVIDFNETYERFLSKDGEESKEFITKLNCHQKNLILR